MLNEKERYKIKKYLHYLLVLFITITTSSVNAKKMDINFSVSKMHNDVTGNFRVSTIAENIHMKDYALEYYNKYFKNDNEIHTIVNFNTKTTTAISDFGLGLLDVRVHEYINKEEHSAKEIFGGMVLEEYYVNKQTGEIEKVR